MDKCLPEVLQAEINLIPPSVNENARTFVADILRSMIRLSFASSSLTKGFPGKSGMMVKSGDYLSHYSTHSISIDTAIYPTSMQKVPLF